MEATWDRTVTDLLLVEASEGLDDAAHQLEGLHQGWQRAGAARESLDHLACRRR